MTIKLWSMQTFTVFKTLEGHEHEVSSVAFMNSGDFLLSCSRDVSIRVWDINSGFCIQKLTQGH
jgi:platelet-activating factor acetylhydrolase IB subunit alpha